MRYLRPDILKDLGKKMVFLGGPRQCGKTTLAQSLMPQFSDSAYFNWDDDIHRKMILERRWGDEQKLIVFDEIHKKRGWKNWIKGIYDTQKTQHSFIVTGSAQLDYYKKGGDSLLGRYHYWRLHPFSLHEIPEKISVTDAFSRLLKVGGFPEPFLDNSEREARRWRRERLDLVVKNDIRDLESVRDISSISLLLDLLRTRVGSPVVYSNLAEDLHVSPLTVQHWIEILERMYLIFIVRPHIQNLPRAIRKPPKIFFYDIGDVDGDEGSKFENLVACHLLKTLNFLEDRDGYRYELKYLRDKESREVDFVVLKDKKPIELVEAKWGDSTISQSLKYYSEKLKTPRSTQIVGSTKKSYSSGNIRVRPAIEDLIQLDRYASSW